MLIQKLILNLFKKTKSLTKRENYKSNSITVIALAAGLKYRSFSTVQSTGHQDPDKRIALKVSPSPIRSMGICVVW